MSYQVISLRRNIRIKDGYLLKIYFAEITIYLILIVQVYYKVYRNTSFDITNDNVVLYSGNNSHKNILFDNDILCRCEKTIGICQKYFAKNIDLDYFL